MSLSLESLICQQEIFYAFPLLYHTFATAQKWNFPVSIMMIFTTVNNDILNEKRLFVQCL